jgi:hypothetical protein
MLHERLHEPAGANDHHEAVNSAFLFRRSPIGKILAGLHTTTSSE